MSVRESGCEDRGKLRGVIFGEGIRLVAVDIEHRNQLTRLVPHGQDDLRPGGTGAGDVARKGIDIGDQLRLTGARCSAADATREGGDHQAAVPT